MKFIKKNIKIIIGFIVGVILASGINVYATYKYFATDVNYAKDGTEISVEDALNELYEKYNNDDKVDITGLTAFGGLGTSFDGFEVGHTYVAIYFSNFWRYSDGAAHITSGAENIKVFASSNTSGRDGGVVATGALILFKATDTKITIASSSSDTYYAMYFIDITNI